MVSQLRLLLSAAAIVALTGCNLIFGLDEPSLAGAGGDTNTGAGSTGGAGAGVGEGGSGAAISDGGGGGSTCPTTCPDDCFEDVCNGDSPVELAPGGQVSCVRLKSGSVWCFGSNRFGGLALPLEDTPDECATTIGGTPLPCSLAALRVDLPGKAQSIAVGHHAACVALENEEVWCWGRNDRGLLGHIPDETVDEVCTGILCRTSPTKIDGLPPASTVVMGEIHACAITSDGLWCWGLNHAGQLGNGAVLASDIGQEILPSQVTAPGKVGAAFANDAVFKVALSGDHTCAVDGAKQLWCWGSNSNGQVGLIKGAPCGLCAEPMPIPTEDFTLTNAIALATPRGATCFLADGATGVQCRGWNGWSFLGSTWDGAPHEQAVAVPNTTDATAIFGADTHICVLTPSGEVRCWGTDFAGQLGDGQVSGAPSTCAYDFRCEGLPKPVVELDASLLQVGNNISMAVNQTGEVLGWGFNQGGQLGHDPEAGGDALCSFYAEGVGNIYCSPTPSIVTGLP